MLIDFHTHVYPEKIADKTVEMLLKNIGGVAYFNGKIDGLVEQMENADANICINLPVLTKPSQFESVLRFGAEINDYFKDKKRKIISFAGIHPQCEDIAGKMKTVRECGFKGVKIHPDFQGEFIDSEGYYQILKSAKDNDLIVVTHAGIDAGFRDQPVKCPPELSKKVLEKINYNKIVWGHFGGLEQWEDVKRYLCDLDIYFDTAFTLDMIDKSLFKEIVSIHGEDKVLFATDSPWRGIADYRKILNFFGFDNNVNDKIFYKNALKLLGMKEDEL